jgi:hypothetical protein
MISAADIIRLSYTPDLIEGGIAYALRTLPYTFDRADGSIYDRMRRIVANAAVELAIRRYLVQNNIPFDVKNPEPFTNPDRYDVAFGDVRCDLHSFLISHRSQVAEIRRDPAVLLTAPALVPSDHHAGQGHGDHDLYLFAFLAGLVPASRHDLEKAIAAGQPHTLVHVMDGNWRRPSNWNPLGLLTLKSESEEELLVEINGQNREREFMARAVTLPPRTSMLVDDPFHSLTCLRAVNLPRARLGIHSRIVGKTCLISPLEWGNIQIYGLDIYLVGYISRGEFRRRAIPLPPNSHVFQYNRTHVKNLALPVLALKPIRRLME